MGAARHGREGGGLARGRGAHGGGQASMMGGGLGDVRLMLFHVSTSTVVCKGRMEAWGEGAALLKGADSAGRVRTVPRTCRPAARVA